MSPRRIKFNLTDILRLAFLLVMLGVSIYFVYWIRLTPQEQTLLFILGGIVLVGGLASIVFLVIYLRRRRARAWKRAMDAWNRSRQDQAVVTYPSVRAFTPAELEKFTAQLFKRMGYRVTHTGKSGDHGVDVRLENPSGQVELVQCKQWHKPVGEPELRDLAGSMLHENAVRGFIVAPGGFSDTARRWVQGKPIALVDEREIGRLVQSAYGDGR